MQNLLGSVDTIIEQNAFYLNAGEGRVGAIDARDVAEIAAKILTDQPDHHHAKIYTLTGPEAISFAQAAAQLQQATGNDVSYVAVPDDTARQSMLDAGVSHWLAGMLVEYGSGLRNGMERLHDQPRGRAAWPPPSALRRLRPRPCRSVHVQAVKRPRTRRCAPAPQRHSDMLRAERASPADRRGTAGGSSRGTS
jgi:hypothetical protein